MEGQGWLCTVMSSKSPGILLSEAGRQPTECSSLDLITLDPLSIFLRTLNYTCISGVSSSRPQWHFCSSGWHVWEVVSLLWQWRAATDPVSLLQLETPPLELGAKQTGKMGVVGRSSFRTSKPGPHATTFLD